MPSIRSLLDQGPCAAWIEDARGRRSLDRVFEASRVFSDELVRDHGSLDRVHVVVQGEPSAAWLAAFLAITEAGGVVVPVPLGAPGPEVRYFVEDSRAAFAVVTHGGPVAFPDGLPVVEALSLADPEEDGGTSLSSASGEDASDRSLSFESGHPALVLYTSGTTGKPKGAILTHENLAHQTKALRDAWAIRDSDVLLHTLPMHHLHGIVVALLTAVSAGASLVMLPRFDVERVIQSLERATVLMAVPTMYQRILEAVDALGAPERERFARAAASLRLATSGSAALPRSLASRWQALTGTIPLERYGMTETGIALSNSLDPEGRRVGAVGRPLGGVEARIVDEAGRETDGPSELWVRGPSVFFGYLGRTEATEKAFREGWFMTGDIAERDSEGVIRLRGRASVDILKTGGEKVSALEIEETFREHPSIAEVAVVGIPDEAWGDRVVAVVVPRPGCELSCEPALVRAWAKERLAPFKVPREVLLFPELPRNAMGKVVKPEIVRQVIAQTRPNESS